MVKALNTLESLKYLEESLLLHESRHFNITGSDEDRKLVKELTDDTYPIYFLVFCKKTGIT